jgi:diacylglycerol kinase (ATP)
MQRKIVYLYNPISGTSKKEGFLKIVERETNHQNIPYLLYKTNAAGNYDELKEIIAQDHYTDVVMMGGDGTINKATQELRGTGVQFGILPVGSGNGLARAAGISVKLKSALALIFSGSAKPIDAFLLNNRYSCMLSGIGFDAQVAHGFANKAKLPFALLKQIRGNNKLQELVEEIEVRVLPNAFRLICP